MSSYVKRFGKKGYKATINYKCRDQVYKVGETYKLKDEPFICNVGFHYCIKAKDTLKYYSWEPGFKLIEIIDLAKSSHRSYDKVATNKMKVLREITDPKELVKLMGFYNSYDKKTGEKTVIDKLTRKVYDKYDRIITHEVIGNSERRFYYPYKNNECGKTTIYFKDKYQETFYTRDGRKKKETNFQTGLVTTYTYQNTKYGTVLKSEVSSDGTSIRYNHNEQVIFKRLPDRSAVTIKYDNDGKFLSSKSSTGREEKCVYNKHNLLVSYANTDGEYINNKYKGKNLISSQKFIIENFENGYKVDKFHFER